MSDRVIEILNEINQKLEIIVAREKMELRKLVKDEFLTTENREKIYRLFDGKHSIQDIADKLDISSENVRLLKTALDENKLLRIRKIGKTEYPETLI